MDQAQEVEMDSLASFKSGKILTITDIQNQVCTPSQMINLLASSNRYGYVFYATESQGLALIPSSYVDQQCSYLAKSSEDDDDDNRNEEQNKDNSIIYRAFIPGQLSNRNLSIIPYWIALNADESILACVLQQVDTHSWLILLYDVVKFIQMPDSPPLCPPLRLQADAIDDMIHSFAWNPAIPSRFIFLDGRGSVASYEVDPIAKQMKLIGQSQPDGDNSSICWSPQGKQFVVAKYDGTLELYEPNLSLKNTYPSIITDPSYPPCINILWISTRQFLLSFSDNNPNEDSFFQILITFDKDKSYRTVAYNDLFFDAPDTSSDINSQYFSVRLNENKIFFTGLSKSSKINVIGPNELNQDSLDIWTFDDQYRAIVKSDKNASNTQPILTGMALGLNSTLSITERGEKLPPCPILFLSNSDGVLQIYYYIQKNLPSICRAPEPIKVSSQISSLPKISSGQQPSSQNLPPSNDSLHSILATQTSAANGFPAMSFGTAPTLTGQSKGIPNFGGGFSFTTPTTQSAINDNSRVPNATAPMMSNPVQRTVTTDVSSPSINPKIGQMVTQYQSKVRSLQQPLAKASEPSMNVDQSITDLIRTLEDMSTSIKQSMDSVKNMTKGHIESMTKMENARHQIRLCQTENLYHRLKDRELDPWTQARLDSIKARYDQVKQSFNVLLQFTHATIHDKSLSTNDEDGENEDFLPDFDISINTTETMKHRIQNRLRELSHKVTETEKEMDSLCTRLKSNSLSSSTFTKTTMSSSILHTSDAQILSHLQTVRPKVIQIVVPPPVTANFSSSDEQKKPSTIEIIKPATPTIQPSTPKSTNEPTMESEGFKNMLRLVRTSIDLFSGATSPEQLQELSSTLATSPLSSVPRSNVTPITKTPTIPKTATNLPKNTTTTITSRTTAQTGNPSMSILQTPAKSVSAPVPTISVTPPTPATQGISTNAAFQPNRTAISTAADVTKTQSTAGENAIRALLNNAASPLTTATSTVNQSTANAALNRMAGNPSFVSNPSSTSVAPTPTPSFAVPATTTIASSAPPATSSNFGGPFAAISTAATSVQSISPTKTPIMSTGFGSRPIIGGAPLNLTTAPSSTIPFGGAGTTAAAGTMSFGGVSSATASSPNQFFNVPASNSSPVTTTSGVPTIAMPTPATTTSAPFAGPFGAPATSAPTTTPFGAPTTSAPTSTPFGAPATSASTATPFGAPTTSAPVTNIFGNTSNTTSPPAASIFGNTSNTTSPPAASIFGNSPASTASPFGTGFANTLTTTTSAPNTGTTSSIFGSNTGAPSLFGNHFNTPATSSSASSSGSLFGAAPSMSSGSTSGGFGSSPFGLNLTSSANSTAPTSTFGTGTSTGSFGSGFSGFGAQPNAAGPSTGFSGFGAQPNAAGSSTGFSGFGTQPNAAGSSTGFSGFGAQPNAAGSSTGLSFSGFGAPRSDTNAAPSGFGSFGSPSAPPQTSSPLGGAIFGGASPQPSTALGASTSPFGASSTQTASSPSFTNYRK